MASFQRSWQEVLQGIPDVAHGSLVCSEIKSEIYQEIKPRRGLHMKHRRRTLSEARFEGQQISPVDMTRANFVAIRGSLICCLSGRGVCATAAREERPRAGAQAWPRSCFILLKQWCALFRWATADGGSEQQADPGTLCNPSSWDGAANTRAQH